MSNACFTSVKATYGTADFEHWVLSEFRDDSVFLWLGIQSSALLYHHRSVTRSFLKGPQRISMFSDFAARCLKITCAPLSFQSFFDSSGAGCQQCASSVTAGRAVLWEGRRACCRAIRSSKQEECWERGKRNRNDKKLQMFGEPEGQCGNCQREQITAEITRREIREGTLL